MAERRYRCAVIGAANIDIGGFSEVPLVPGDSNPGKVCFSAGGVGRNIACTLAKLGVHVELVTALGQDPFSDVIRESCLNAGVGLGLSPKLNDAASSVYLYIADEQGSMRMAVNDMAACARLTPEALEPCVLQLNAMDAVVLDANLPEDTLCWLAMHLKPPLLADAVSAAKAVRLKRVLPRLAVLKPNALEAHALTGIRVTDAATAMRSARALTNSGVSRAFVTLGAAGVVCDDGAQARLLHGIPVEKVSDTGAGDAFTAALAWATLEGLDLRESAIAALAAASITMESAEAVNPGIDAQSLRARMLAIRSANDA